MSFSAFFHRATDREPYPYQSAFASAQELPRVLAVPTGTGKTATAVLGWLWRRRFAATEVRATTPRRLVFCLPMRTLVEQTEMNVNAWLQRLELIEQVRVHALLGGAVDDAFEGRPEDDAILIGTQDQLLSRALNRGYAMSRFRWPVHFGLLNNDVLWVLDEVQLMGPGLSTSAQLQGLRDRLGTVGPARSLWMSATMAAGKLRTIDHQDADLRPLRLGPEDLGNPELRARVHARKALERASVTFDPKGSHVPGLARTIVDRHVAGSLTLVVLNRVARAQVLFAELRKLGADVRLVHSRFRPADRRKAQSEVLAKGWSGVLVATQAIEAGVDISAQLLVTEIAPWSSLVQRFGRCNRDGRIPEGQAKVVWLDLPDDEAAPYKAEDLAPSRARLAELDDVGPEALERFPSDTGDLIPPVLRRRDLLDLFDTQSDLGGRDIDVSPFIRATDDRDVQVAWRQFSGPPALDTPDLARDELCSVDAYRLDGLLRKNKARAWRWSSLEGAWEEVERLVPGMTVLLQADTGFYDDALGFTGLPKDRPTPLSSATSPPAADESDRRTYGCSQYVALSTHSQDVAEELGAMRESLGDAAPWEALEKAARWHDLGKAHAAFQEMLTGPLPTEDPRRTETLWAKSDRRGGKNPRSHFRHELASALALLAHGGSDLEAFLVAAHHGKVRMSIRSRVTERRAPDGRRYALGVWEGDVLPEVDLGSGVVVPSTTLHLDAMELGDGRAGPSWLSRMLGLLEHHGPFRLAFWESLVRVADWRGTDRWAGRAEKQREAPGE